jgi:hypothetical protein
MFFSAMYAASTGNWATQIGANMFNSPTLP